MLLHAFGMANTLMFCFCPNCSLGCLANTRFHCLPQLLLITLMVVISRGKAKAHTYSRKREGEHVQRHRCSEISSFKATYELSEQLGRRKKTRMPRGYNTVRSYHTERTTGWFPPVGWPPTLPNAHSRNSSQVTYAGMLGMLKWAGKAVLPTCTIVSY